MTSSFGIRRRELIVIETVVLNLLSLDLVSLDPLLLDLLSLNLLSLMDGMGDIGYRGRGCVSLESEGKEMSRLSTDRQTDRHVNIELEFCETEFAINQNKKIFLDFIKVCFYPRKTDASDF